MVLFVALLTGLHSATAAVQVAFNAPGDVGLTANGFAAAGETVEITLNFDPSTAARLIVVKNTGPAFIEGTFGNLAQGQEIGLTYAGFTYRFVANYYGGSGRDLVLQWRGTAAKGWGANSRGQIGDNTRTNRSGAVDVFSGGILSGKTILSLAVGEAHSLALCSDGTVAAWGSNDRGELGNNSTASSSVPVAVDASVALSGKTVIAVAAGRYHSLALCSDGTVAAWGSNENGQLGINSTINSSVPVAVDPSGVLSGRIVTGVAAGGQHNLALCSDGTVAAWGSNEDGQLGNNSTLNSSVPLAVDPSAALSGKTVVAVTAGRYHSLALCSDGTVASWGSNELGQLGNGGFAQSPVAVLVDTSGALAGKTVAMISAGLVHNLALCSDGRVVAWGFGRDGQLGNNKGTNSFSPEVVSVAGVLPGRTVTMVSAGVYHSLALCSDDTLAAWGGNANGQFGNYSTANSAVPVEATSIPHPPKGRLAALASGASASHILALATFPPAAITGDISSLHSSGTTVQGMVNAGGGSATVSFEYGPTAGYGFTANAAPLPVTGSSNTAVSAVITGLTPGRVYHYRVRQDNTLGLMQGTNRTFITPPALSDIIPSAGTLVPSFTSETLSYSMVVPGSTSLLAITPTSGGTINGIRVNGLAVDSGTSSGAIALNYGHTTIKAVVAAEDGTTTRTYTIVALRALPESWTPVFTGPDDIGTATDGFTASGSTVYPVLNYAPSTGADLTVVNNSGLDFINGTFSNLPQGQEVSLIYRGVTYRFIANYFGGTGNDLVLQWAATRAVAWGANTFGQIGDNSSTGRLVTTNVLATGVLSGKSILAVAAGRSHSLALCSDGSVAAWGSNTYGELGNNSGSLSGISSKVPTGVIRTGVLSGRTVVALAAGVSHSLALCSDGNVAAWGSSTGRNNPRSSLAPVMATDSAGLAGKKVAAVAAGDSHSLLLYSNGTVAAWGDNTYGQLGDTSTVYRYTPVAVSTTGVLAGRTVVAVAAGRSHSLALCSDGTVVAWGRNVYGQLGNKTLVDSPFPVAVATDGTLAGKRVTALAGGGSQSLALCSDGTLGAWGANVFGQLGNNTTALSTETPVTVISTGLLAGKTVVSVVGGGGRAFALCADGTLAAWGGNLEGRLGNNSLTNSLVPVAVSTAPLAAGERFVRIAQCAGDHTVAMVGSPAATADSDSDRDGLAGFVETYFGTNPAVPDGTPWSLRYSGGEAYLDWPEAAPAGITVTPQWSPDLITWLGTGETLNGIPSRPLTVTGGSPKQAAIDTAGLSRIYLRLKLQLQ